MNKPVIRKPGSEDPAPDDLEKRLISQALLIRRTEERFLSLFSEGKLNGTVHTCIGQEWVGVAIAAGLGQNDIIVSNHRGHGHFIAWTGDVEGLTAEIMGRATGVCGGKGGSQHLHAPGFFSNGVQGGMVPVAAGLALAQSLHESDGIVVVFVGDGTLGEGVLYETLNLASKWAIPLLIVVENNGYAQSTASTQTLAGSVEARASAFGIPFAESNTWDWRRLLTDAAGSIEQVRTNRAPLLLEIKTYRLKAHSKGDDNRAPEEIGAFVQKDSLTRLLNDEPQWLPPLLSEIDHQVEQAVQLSESAPHCSLPEDLAESDPQTEWQEVHFEQAKISDILYDTFRGLLQSRPDLLMLGEDIEGGYGGAFKVTRDLSELFPSRVRNTPISEAAITGVGAGASMAGFPALVEIMFGDFLSLTFDQLQQHACKFERMYDGKVQVPLILRTPMGGRRGYGPTHSQSIEKHFLGIPGLDVVALNARWSPRRVYQTLCECISHPAVVIENKVLYTRYLDAEPPRGFRVTFSNEPLPCVRISPARGNAAITIFCYGGMLEEAERAVQDLFDDEEVLGEIICPTQLHPLNINPVLHSVRSTGRLLVAEEGPCFAALGSEVAARVAEAGVQLEAFGRLGHNDIVPSSIEAERACLPSARHIARKAMEMIS